MANSATTATSAWSVRLSRIRDALACPDCRAALVCGSDAATCPDCGRRYPVRGGKIYFVEPMSAEDPLDVIKHRLKSWFGGGYYRFGVAIIGPTYPFNFRKAVLRHCRPETEIVVDLGSGNNRIDPAVITLDGTDYAEVDIVADLARLPFRSGSIDGLVSRSVLEHLRDLPAAVHELVRCTAPGGRGLHLIPFLFPYHASPHDYQRLTHSGAAALFPGWQVVEQRNATGPVSLFVTCLVEFLAILCSFGSARLKGPAYLVFCLLLFPLKYLDAPFVGRKAFLHLAPSILTVVRKP